MRLLPGGESLFALGTPAAVDAAGRKILAVEPDLDGEGDVDGHGRFRGRRDDRRRQRLRDGRRRLEHGRGRRLRRRGRRSDRHVDAAGEAEENDEAEERKSRPGFVAHARNMAEAEA